MGGWPTLSCQGTSHQGGPVLFTIVGWTLPEAGHLSPRLQGQDWVSQLPWVLLGLRSAPKEKANISSTEMVYSTALMLLGEFLDTPEAEVERWVEKLRSEAASFSPPPTAAGPAMEAAEIPGSAAVLPVCVREGRRSTATAGSQV